MKQTAHQAKNRQVKDQDEDPASMSGEELLNEVKKLRKGIREHRDSSGHDLCWYHPTPSGEGRSHSRGPGVAAIHARMYQIPAITGR